MSARNATAPACHVYSVSGDVTALPAVKAAFAALYCCIICSALLGNALVILAIGRNAPLRTVRNFFILSLSCSDIVVVLASGVITPTSIFEKQWHFGPALCKGFSFIQALCVSISTLCLASIAVDRYILIVHPTWRAIKRRHAMCMITAVWTVAACVATPPAAFVAITTLADYCGVYCMETWPNQAVKTAYGTMVFAVLFVLPLLVISVCYASIFWRLRARERVRQACVLRSPQPTSRSAEVHRRRHRTNLMLTFMVVAFAFSWLPQMTLLLLGDYDVRPPAAYGVNYLCGLLCHSVAMTSTVWNPVLYAWFNDNFRIAFIALTPRWLRSACRMRVTESACSVHLEDRRPSVNERLVPATCVDDRAATATAVANGRAGSAAAQPPSPSPSPSPRPAKHATAVQLVADNAAALGAGAGDCDDDGYLSRPHSATCLEEV